MLYAVTAWKWKFGREKEGMKVSDVKASRRGPIWRSRCLPAQSLISSGTNASSAVSALPIIACRSVGAAPGGVPIEFPTRVDLVVNLRTAKALGLTIPESFLFRAEEVIE